MGSCVKKPRLLSEHRGSQFRSQLRMCNAKTFKALASDKDPLLAWSDLPSLKDFFSAKFAIASNVARTQRRSQ